MLEDEAELSALRQRYRDWLAEAVPTDWRARSTTADAAFEVQREWVKALAEGGWAAPQWPVEFGGLGLDLAGQIAFEEENARVDAPTPTMFGMSFTHAAATLMEAGSAEQQREHLPRIRTGDEVWCQCFSEPNAGSDLASLTTRAVRDGDEYVVNGQKIWSSGAHHADWAMLLARTGPPGSRSRGISYFLLDLRSPGVEIRPIRSLMDTAEFCEVFFEDVRIPARDRIGEEGDGWRIAQTTLTTERGVYLLPVMNSLRGQADALVALLEAAEPSEQAHLEQVVARDYAEVAVLSEVLDNVLTAAGDGRAGPESSILKVAYSELAQRVTGDGLAQSGLSGQTMWPPSFDNNSAVFDGNWGRQHYWSWSWTIAGGSNEVQKNIIAERILGLPREPQTPGERR
jgi:alkylation response protein AidB-like acyl-CoA dehydrogenase